MDGPGYGLLEVMGFERSAKNRVKKSRVEKFVKIGLQTPSRIPGLYENIYNWFEQASLIFHISSRQSCLFNKPKRATSLYAFGSFEPSIHAPIVSTALRTSQQVGWGLITMSSLTYLTVSSYLDVLTCSDWFHNGLINFFISRGFMWSVQSYDTKILRWRHE